MQRELRMSDLLPSMNAPFTVEPQRTALVIVDMQYATASRTTGLGKTAKEAGQAKADALEYRFSRIEKVAVPNIQKLLDFFRKNKLRIIYITNGSEMPGYSDCLPHRRHQHGKWRGRAFARAVHRLWGVYRGLPGRGHFLSGRRRSAAFCAPGLSPRG